MKVYIVHPTHDYGADSAHATRESAEAYMKGLEIHQWAEYKVRRSKHDLRGVRLKKSDFIGKHYIQELEVRP